MRSRPNRDRYYIIEAVSLRENLRDLKELQEQADDAIEELIQKFNDLTRHEEDYTKIKRLQEIFSMYYDTQHEISEFYLSLDHVEFNVTKNESYEKDKSEIKELEKLVIDAFENLDKAHYLIEKIKEILHLEMRDYERKLSREIDNVIGIILEIEGTFEPIKFTGEFTGRTGYIGRDGVYFDY